MVHHSLPLFVPIEELEKSLKSSVTEFGTKVRQHLQAFVARRHIALQLKVSFGMLTDFGRGILSNVEAAPPPLPSPYPLTE